MQLLYNIDFEISAALFLAFLALYVRQQFEFTIQKNRLFLRLLLLVIGANLADVITAVTISYGSVIPPWVNMILNTLYCILNMSLGFCFLAYTRSLDRTRFNNKASNNIVEWIILIIYIGLLTINLSTGFVFEFNEQGQYVHGPVYILIFAMPYVFFFSVAVLMFRSARHFSRRQRISIILYVVVGAVGPILQLLWFPDVLLSVFSISLAITIVLFALETPEYHRLLDTMEELQEANKRAESANEAKSRYLANISHEIRTPINAVLGMDEMILRESTEENVLTYAKRIQSAGDTMLSLINDILDFSKMEAGKFEIIPVEYKLRDVMEECHQMVSLRAKEKNLDVRVFCDPSIPNALKGDEVRIKEIINNLLTNAVKYTKVGTITFRVKMELKNEKELMLLLSVEDTGKGIAKENIPSLFSSFERFDKEENRHIEGTGLGLAITKQLVELMDGEIGVFSELGKGSLFYVRIPQEIVAPDPIGDYEEKVKGVSKTVYHQSFVAPKARILVVDDVSINLEVIRNLLKKTKLRIDTADCGEECINLCETNQYQVILLDHMMPGMDGVETLQRLKDLPECINANTPVIALTANAISGVREQYLEAGFNDYLSKPVTGADLEKMIQKYLPKEFLEEE